MSIQPLGFFGKGLVLGLSENLKICLTLSTPKIYTSGASWKLTNMYTTVFKKKDGQGHIRKGNCVEMQMGGIT